MAGKRGGQHHEDGDKGFGVRGRDKAGGAAGEQNPSRTEEAERQTQFSQAEADRRAAEYAKRHPNG